jgi:NitT/TauT family transport system permease protein
MKRVVAIGHPMAAARLAFGFGVLVVWEIIVRAGLVTPFWFSAPTLIGARLWELAARGDLLLHARTTMAETVLGLASGTIVGVGAGMVLGAMPWLRRVLEPYVIVLNAFPKIALAPLFLVWFGVALSLKVAMAFSLVVFVMMLGTMAGFVNVRQVWIDHVVALGATRTAVVRLVVVPALVPWVYASFQLAVGFALMGAVLGEFVATQAGVGYLIDEGVGMFDTTTVFAGLFVLLALALVLNGLVEWGARRLGVARFHRAESQIL